MHYYGIAIIKSQLDAHSEVHRLMDRYYCDPDRDVKPLGDDHGHAAHTEVEVDSHLRIRDPYFDWMVIGGRWRGALNPPQTEDGRAELESRDPWSCDIKRNIAQVANILKTAHVPAFMVTPDGRWHKGPGLVDSPERRDWFCSLLSKHPEHYAVVVDIHQ